MEYGAVRPTEDGGLERQVITYERIELAQAEADVEAAKAAANEAATQVETARTALTEAEAAAVEKMGALEKAQSFLDQCRNLTVAEPTGTEPGTVPASPETTGEAPADPNAVEVPIHF